MPRSTLAAVALAAGALVATGAVAQPAADRPASAPEDDAADAYGEMLRRTDPAAHARYERLRAAREASLAELQAARERYHRAGPELRAVSLPQLRAASRKFAADSLALLDFLDERDRLALEQYRAAIEQLQGLLDQRAHAREELKELMKE
jgi:hypothetical protein